MDLISVSAKIEHVETATANVGTKIDAIESALASVAPGDAETLRLEKRVQVLQAKEQVLQEQLKELYALYRQLQAGSSASSVAPGKWSFPHDNLTYCISPCRQFPICVDRHADTLLWLSRRISRLCSLGLRW